MLSLKNRISRPVSSDREPRLEAFGRIAVSVLMLFVMGFLFLTSLIHTTGMEVVAEGKGIETVVYSIKEKLESVIYYNDSFVFNLIYLAVGLLLCFLIVPRMNKIPIWAEIAFVFLWTLILGCIWVNSSMLSPTEDSYMVSSASVNFAGNNFDPLNDEYFSNYSFQLGYVLFNEILVRIHNLFTPFESYTFLEILNVVFLAAAYAGIILLIDRIFPDKRVRHLTAVILLLSIQPIIFCTFIYGIIPGLMFAVWAIYFEVLYLQKSSIPFGIISIVLIAIAVMVKSNYLIFLIAMLITAFVKMFGRKKFIHDIVYIILAGAVAMSVSPIVKASYENRSGIKIGDAVPYSSWIAMGLNESDLAPGWYSWKYTVGNMEDNNHDADAAGDVSKKEISHRLSLFFHSSQYTHDFFYKKTVSQWNETSYQSIWNNQVRNYSDRGSIAEWVCGKGEMSVKKYMDIFTQLIFAGVLLGVLMCLKNKNFLSAVIPMIIFGGFLYHTISEGKSQYIMPYYILMTGFAAYGICALYDRMKNRFSSNRILAAVFGIKKSPETVEVKEES